MFVITLFRLLRSRHHHVVMDIQKWLAHADLDRAPDEPQGRRIQSREKNNVVTSPSPDHASHSRQSLASHASEIGPYSKRRARRHSPASQESTIFSASSSVSSTIWPPSSELYKRRKRHKTRENLYEPYSGVRKNRSGRRRGDDGRKRKKAGKSKTKHRRTEKPSKPSKPGQKLLEDFNAPNVGSSRLIVRIS